MKKRTIWIAIIIVIIFVIAVSEFNMQKSKQNPIDINAEFLRDNWAGASEGYDVEEVLYVEKFTDNESIAIVLAKDSKGIPCVYEIYDGRSRYDNAFYVEIADFSNLSNQYDYYELEPTKFGQPYFSLYENPLANTVFVNGKEHNVYKFECTINGVQYNLGFYCGINT